MLELVSKGSRPGIISYCVTHKEAWVKDNMQLSSGVMQWNVSFLRAA